MIGISVDTRETYNKIAQDWHEDHKSDDWWISGTDTFASLVSTGGRILDVGSGGGYKSRYLIQKGFQVVGIDSSEKLIEIAKEEVPEARFIVMDMRDADTLEQEFDGIFAQASLLHIPKKEVLKVLTTLNVKLRRGGYLYVAVKEGWSGRPDEEIKEENDYGYVYKRFFSYYTMTELKDYFEQLGLTIVYEDIHKSGQTNWLQIIGKKNV